MRRSKFLAGGAALAAVAAASPARAQFSNGTQYLQQSTIGVSVPLSGAQQQYGVQVVYGVRAAIDYNNRFAAPLERGFGIRTFDDQSSVALAMTNAQIGAADPSIVAMIGNLTADVTNGALSQYAGVGMPLIVPTVTQDRLTTQGYRNIWRLPTKDSTEGALFARTALDNLKVTFALAITQDGDYGSDVAQGFVAQAKSRGRRSDLYVFSLKQSNYMAAAKEIADKHPDYIFLAGKTEDMGPLLPALHDAGYTGAFGASDGFYNESTIKQYAGNLHGAWVASSLAPLNRAPSNFQILSELQRTVGSVSAFSAYGYAAAQIVMSAMKRAGATTRAALMQTMQMGGSYDTLVGPYSFSFTGDATDPNVYFYSVGDGGFTYEKPAHRTGFIM
jgi:branched-chain amino acid transport system substrate-binding protein